MHSFYKTSKCKAEVLETRRGEPRIVRCPQVRQCGLDARRPRRNPNAPPVVAPVSDVARHRNLIVVMLLRVGRSAEGDGVSDSERAIAVGANLLDRLSHLDLHHLDEMGYQLPTLVEQPARFQAPDHKLRHALFYEDARLGR